MLWIPVTVLAAALQTARNAMQSGFTGSLGVLGATQARLLYGFPFALMPLAIAALVTQSAVPSISGRFLFTCGGALMQILATALLLRAMLAVLVLGLLSYRTLVRMEHSGFRPEDEAGRKGMGGGWPRILERLAAIAAGVA